MAKPSSQKTVAAPTPLLLGIPHMKGIELFLLKDIICFEGNGKDTNIYILYTDITNGIRIIKRTATRCLKYYQDRLPEIFMRVHKSFIVNVSYLRGIARNNQIEFSHSVPVVVKTNAEAKKQLMKNMV
jgi:DNA-binding LytR/AlgR family response regulator